MKSRWQARFFFVIFLSGIILSGCHKDDMTPNGVGLSKIALNLSFNVVTSGNLELTVRDVSTQKVKAISVRPITGYNSASDGWIDFKFSPGVKIERGKAYQIELKRTTPNNALSDVVLWRSANGDAYGQGESRVNGAGAPPNGDFAFRVFVEQIVDQQQEDITEVNLVSDTYTYIQGFVVGE